MKQEKAGLIPFLKRYHSLIAWGICLCLVVMTFFQRHLPGEWWIFVMGLGIFVNLYFVSKNSEAYPLPGRFRGWIIAVVVLCGVFATVNFFISLVELAKGDPRILDGAYIIDYKGTVADYITQREYHRLKCVEQRFIAGHMLFFYAGAMFLHCDRKIKLQVWTWKKVKKGD